MDYQRITAVLLGNATQDAAMKTAKGVAIIMLTFA